MINTTEFNVRLQEIITHYDLSASAFAEKISVQRSSISHILSGRNKPSLDFINKILEAFPEIDLVWILSGVGELRSDSTTRFNTVTDNPTLKSKPVAVQASAADSDLIDKIVVFYRDGTFKNYSMKSTK